MGPRVLVLGAGVSGLSSAVCVQQACPEAQVQLVSEHFSPDTTSDGSAGFWGPYLIGETDALLALWGNPTWKGIVEGFKQLSEDDMKQFDPSFETGTFYTALSVDVTPYLEWLMNRFKRQGGIVRQAKIENIEEVASQCDILINCSAMSSWHLFQDKDMFPIRGQVWKVQAPWVKHFYFLHEKDEDTTYVIPGVDLITVGGTAQMDDWNRNTNPEDGALMWEKAVTHFPMLQQATLVKSWVGLRPARKSLRLESETLNVDGRSIKVIHNYGHGGSGITMHWGCALEVTRMVLEALGTERKDAQRIVSRL
ncbi:D-aspartate oxidase [Plakobranchus ocellatus]|uniref:D-aspartate oxidase n=1 Tax=Plakobranchus ocellatus TaxID=259542 RepID=A0AAV3ZKY4_9GAST|nr:D-aspartate oxidase [Plakobranchus ocellatus]